jgi:hypothetical protein
MNELFSARPSFSSPSYDDMFGAIRCEHVIHTHETPMRMQVRRTKAYVWTFRAGKNII